MGDFFKLPMRIVYKNKRFSREWGRSPEMTPGLSLIRAKFLILTGFSVLGIVRGNTIIKESRKKGVNTSLIQRGMGIFNAKNI